MKMKMKMKNLVLLVLTIVLTCPVFSQTSSMENRRDNWTKEAPQTRGMPGGVGGEGPSEDPDSPNNPVGETTWALILGLGSIYGIYVFNRKRKEVN